MIKITLDQDTIILLILFLGGLVLLLNGNQGDWLTRAQKKQFDRYDEVRTNWNKFYEKEEEKRQEEIANDPYYNLDADDKLLARQIKVDRSEPTFEEWKAAKKAKQEQDTKSNIKEEINR